MKYLTKVILIVILFTSCKTGSDQLTYKQQSLEEKSIDSKWLHLNKDIIDEILSNTAITLKDIKLDTSVKLIQTLYYYGGDLPPATMYLYENGLLILDSGFYSKNNENRFFLWSSFDNSGIRFTFIDNRINFDRSAEVAEWHLKNHKDYVHFIDIENRHIVFGFVYGGLFYGGFIFYPNENPYK
jgi:hypothetical protein